MPGSRGTPARVEVRDGSGDRMLAAVTPFPGFEGTPSVAMADVNGDNVLDLLVGTGPGIAPQVVAYSGADGGQGPFRTELARFGPLDAGFKGGISVAAADLDGNAHADNIIVGSGPGTDSRVTVFSSTLPTLGATPEVFSTFTPYPGSRSGVTLATGTVDVGTGRPSIVTAPGPGEPARIKTFRYDLYSPTEAARARGGTTGPGRDPAMTAEFDAYDPAYTGGVSLSTGWVAGAEGGAQSVITGQLTGPGEVRVWSTGSRLDGGPAMYLHSPEHHAAMTEFAQIASFTPFPGQAGVRVATSSTTTGADLIVSGMGPGGSEVRKYALARPEPTARTVAPTLLTTLPPQPAATPAPLGGR